MSGLPPSVTGLLHVDPSIVLTAFPPYATATHDVLPGTQETESKSSPLSAVVVVHFRAPPVGSVDATELPFWSTATHSGADVHETAVSRVLLSTLTGLLQVEPPFVDVTTSPPPSTATHRDVVEGHDTPFRPFALIGVVLHAEAPPVGFVDRTASPFPSTATQSDAVWQETPLRNKLLASMLAAVQAEGPPVGLVDVTTFPDWSTATQSEAEGHETARRVPFARSSGMGADQVKDAPAASAAGTARGRATKTTATSPSQCQDRRKVGASLLRLCVAIKPASDCPGIGRRDRTQPGRRHHRPPSPGASSRKPPLRPRPIRRPLRTRPRPGKDRTTKAILTVRGRASGPVRPD